MSLPPRFPPPSSPPRWITYASPRTSVAPQIKLSKVCLTVGASMLRNRQAKYPLLSSFLPLPEPIVQTAVVVDSCHDTPYPVPNSPVRLNHQGFLFTLLITPGERYFDCCFSSHGFRTFTSFSHLQRAKIVTLDVPYS